MEPKNGKIIYKELSYNIVGVLYEVYNNLGYGYQEKVYEKAVAKGLKENSLDFKRQAPYKVIYKNECIAIRYIDFIVKDKIVLELKRGKHYSKNNIKQIKEYLSVTGLKLAIIASFTSDGVKIFRALNPNNLKNNL
ncbi:MAG TPA: GxxExxY protein [Patescibacteria group bacterium]|nr:GxxExxY protein [Patescibacteria group bacterium]